MRNTNPQPPPGPPPPGQPPQDPPKPAEIGFYFRGDDGKRVA
jgi:hypothetical protein